ncbi:MAG TPA: SufS family cysteine desulfurase [Oligoflexia bacterium]|nr:SufS family cysteine desulfurase [Oligoflexia bacterium]
MQQKDITNKKKFDIDSVRKDFPILNQTINSKPLVYFDNAASTQKPNQMIDQLCNFLKHDYANVHRGIHTLSQRSTLLLEDTRKKIQTLLGAQSENEIIFLRGVTEASNLLAHVLQSTINPNDEIIITEMEHHSNIVPWQMLAQSTGAQIKVIPINDMGELNLESYKSLLNSKTKLVAFSHISNALGTINPIKNIIDLAHEHNALTILDAAQSVAHKKIDVQDINCDFLMFSAHKLYGPTGFGALYGKENLLNSLPPFHGGGEMIDQVTTLKSTYKLAPARFEAGTPNIMGAVAFGASLDYFNQFNIDELELHEHRLLESAQELIKTIPGIKILGHTQNKSAILSFYHENIHSNDIAMILDQMGIAVRSGHHCAQPIMDHFKINSSCRASFAMYNTLNEVDYFITALRKAIKMLGK